MQGIGQAYKPPRKPKLLVIYSLLHGPVGAHLRVRCHRSESPLSARCDDRSERGGVMLTVPVTSLLPYAAPGPNDRFRERAASGSLAAVFVIHQRISRSPAVVPAVSASKNHCGLRPRPDQVSAGFSGCRYFGGTGARAVFVSVPTSSARV